MKKGKVVCDLHGNVEAVSILFQTQKDYKHPDKYTEKAICLYCLYDMIEKHHNSLSNDV